MDTPQGHSGHIQFEDSSQRAGDHGIVFNPVFNERTAKSIVIIAAILGLAGSIIALAEGGAALWFSGWGAAKADDAMQEVNSQIDRDEKQLELLNRTAVRVEAKLDAMSGKQGAKK